MPLLALGAVDLIALLVALAALLVLGALWVFAKPIEIVLGKVPFIGGYMNGLFTNGLKDAMFAVASTYDSGVHAVAHLFWALGVGIWHLVYQIVQAIDDAKNQAVYATLQALNAVAAAENFAQTLFHQAVATAGALVNDAEAAAAALVAGAIADLTGLINGVRAVAVALAGDAVATAQDLFNDALDQITSAVNRIEVLIGATADAVLSEAVRLFGIADADTKALVGTVEAQVAGLAGELHGVEADLAPLLGALPLVGAIPGLITEVTTITTHVDECLDPLCDTVTPNAPQLGKLGQFLKDLESLGEDALFAALFVEAVTDPAGLAHEVVTVMEDIADPVITAARDLAHL